MLDNLESLLSDSGQWRDERWGMLIDALLTPGGLSRTVLTSRIRPGLPSSAEIVPVHALPLKEALLLVRELPNLRRLLDGKTSGVTLDAGRLLVRRALRLVQGHPKLIELAENVAVDPQRLAAQLDRADAAEGGSSTHFFASAKAASMLPRLPPACAIGQPASPPPCPKRRGPSFIFSARSRKVTARAGSLRRIGRIYGSG